MSEPYNKCTIEEKLERAKRIARIGSAWKIDVNAIQHRTWYQVYQGHRLTVIDVFRTATDVRVLVQLPPEIAGKHAQGQTDFPYKYLCPYNVDPDESREMIERHKKLVEQFYFDHLDSDRYSKENVRKAMWTSLYGAGQSIIDNILETGESKRRSKKVRRLAIGQEVRYQGRIGEVIRYNVSRRSYDVKFVGEWMEEITEEHLINCGVLTLIKKEEQQIFKVESYVEINGTKVQELSRQEFIRLVQAEQKRLASLKESATATGSKAIEAEVAESEEALKVAVEAYDKAQAK